MKINCNPPYNVKYTCSVTNLMDNCDKKSLVIYVITLLLLSSCGARRVELEQQKVRTKELTEMVLKLQNDIQSNITMRKVATKKIVEPVDPKLPSTYNGQDFKNARITEQETTTDSTATMKDKSTTDINSSNQTDTSSESVKKDVDREGNGSDIKWSIWGVGFILLCGIVIFFILNKKGLPSFLRKAKPDQ